MVISIVILISGVVLLTLKKPESRGLPPTPGILGSARSIRLSRHRSDSKQDREREKEDEWNKKAGNWMTISRCGGLER
jgi:hypothetical protein